jgi:pilus assembly protein CpaB
VRPRSIIAIVLALVFGGSAAFGVRQFLGRRTAAPAAETVSVIVAAMNIPRGMLVTPDAIKTQNYPKDLAPTGAILKKEDALDRSAFTTMVMGEPLLESKLSPKGQRGLASLITDGKRAFTISTNVSSGVAGFILPGNKVDVLLTFSAGGANDLTGGGSTTTLLQNLEILAVDQKVEAPADNKVDSTNLRSVTLLVTPDEAERLSLGQNKGTLHLTLRNPNDKLAAAVKPTTVNDIQFNSQSPLLLDAKVSRKAATEMASIIANEMRAFTITTDVSSGVAGFIHRDSWVDVLLTTKGGGTSSSTDGGSTKTLIQNLKILAVDQQIEVPENNKADGTTLRTVTLLVTPGQAAKLSLAQSNGTLHLTLRKTDDHSTGDVPTMHMSDIGDSPPPPLIKENPIVVERTIRTIRGSSEGTVTLTPTGSK